MKALLVPGTVLFYHKKKNLGASMDVRGDQTGAVTVRLQPCGAATGRVVDADGQPLANQPLILERLLENGRAASVLSGGYVEAKTDKDGRFRAEGLVPGVWGKMSKNARRTGNPFAAPGAKDFINKK